MNIERVTITLTLLYLSLTILATIFSFYIGYLKGFNKCEQIHNELLEELANKYKNI